MCDCGSMRVPNEKRNNRRAHRIENESDKVMIIGENLFKRMCMKSLSSNHSLRKCVIRMVTNESEKFGFFFLPLLHRF